MPNIWFKVSGRIILTCNSVSSLLPVIVNNNPRVIYLPYYSYIGYYLASIIAYDPVKSILISNYDIISQPMNANTGKPYFSIDKLNGFC